MQIADRKFLEVTLQVGGGGRPPRGDTPTQTPKATGQRGDRAIGQSGSAIVFGWKRRGMNGPLSISAPFLEHWMKASWWHL